MYLQDIPVLYINLKRDVSRRKIIDKDLADIGTSFKRIDAVYGKYLYDPAYRKKLSKRLGVPTNKLKPEYWLNRSNFKTMDNNKNSVLSKVGCYLSHLLAIKKAYNENYNKVLILEDDAMPLINAFDKFVIPKDADIYYVGGGYFYLNGESRSSAKHIKIDTNKLKICGTFAYIIPNKENIKHMYNLFMSVFKDGKGHDKTDNWKTNTLRLRAQASDFMIINFIQKAGNAYISNPPKFSFREFTSNITNNRQKYKLTYFLNNSQQYKMLGRRELYGGLYKLLTN